MGGCFDLVSSSFGASEAGAGRFRRYGGVEALGINDLGCARDRQIISGYALVTEYEWTCPLNAVAPHRWILSRVK